MTSCSYHASKDAVGSCVICGKLICRACQSEIDGKSYCPPCVEKLFTTSEAKAQATPELAAAKPEGQAVNPAWWLLPVFLSLVGGLAAWLANKEHNAGMARYMLFTGIGIAVVQGLVGLILVVVLMAPSAVKPGQNPSAVSAPPQVTNPAPPAGTGGIATGPRAPAVTQSPATLPLNPGQQPPAITSLPQAPAGDSASPRSARTGDITTGPKVQATSQSIDSLGGTIAVSKPGDPLDGFVIDVPANSYPESRTFKVSSAPITNQTFGDDINPVSPMISVDNGGGYASAMMCVRVPVKVPEDSFAMGFFYDEKTMQLEGMELVGSDAESVTVATRHFSNFFVSMIKKALLKNDIDSGFRPGIDDWQFPNEGSFIAPGGHCEGQALTAMWYYCTQPDGKDMCLYGRYDNNGNKPATPDLWQDDSLGYRFCSVIQNETRFGDNITVGNATLGNFWDNLAGVAWELKNINWVKKDVPGIGDEATFNLFAYSIRASRQPQEVGIYSNAGGGHSMIVYKVVGNALYIADPNYQGNTERKIIYYSGERKFKPYNTAANRKLIDAGQGQDFEKIVYTAKSTVVPWDTIARRWAEFKNKTIGNDKFPAYEIQYKDDKGNWQELKDGYVSPVKLIGIETDPWRCDVYRDGAVLKMDDKFKYELKPGNNLLGIYTQGILNEWKYKDFRYINVIYNGLTIDPPSLEGEPGKEYTFTAKSESPPAKARYEWTVDGMMQATQTDVIKLNTSKLDTSKTTPHPITCKLFDAAKPGSKALAEAAASLIINSCRQIGNCRVISVTPGGATLVFLQHALSTLVIEVCDKGLVTANCQASFRDDEDQGKAIETLMQMSGNKSGNYLKGTYTFDSKVSGSWIGSYREKGNFKSEDVTVKPGVVTVHFTGTDSYLVDTDGKKMGTSDPGDSFDAVFNTVGFNSAKPTAIQTNSK